MSARVFLHVGTPKSGTTFLQSVWWANKPALREQGLLVPGRGINDHYWASCEVRGGPPVRHVPEHGHHTWERLLRRVAEFEQDALISHELFSAAAADRTQQALEDLARVADEVHVIVTARDLVRQIPAEWQQRTKHGHSQTFAEFVEQVQHDSTMHFWRVQDVPAVLDRWSLGVDPGRTHLVVLPPAGGPSTVLWEQLCAVTGVDGNGMPERVARRNESLGLAEAEVMRRISGELNQEGLPKSTERILKNWFAEQILRSAERERIVLPASAYPWVVERARLMVDELGARQYHVVGNLEDLAPSPEPSAGRSFEQLSESEVTAVAVRALARFVKHEERSRARAQEAAAARRAEAQAAPATEPQAPAPVSTLQGGIWRRLGRRLLRTSGR
jgi:hypothetical protein